MRTGDLGPKAWGSVHGDPGATRSTEAAAHLGGELRWEIDAGASPSAAAVTDGTAIYLPLDDGRLLAVAAEDGRVIWTRRYAHSVTAPAAVAEGRLYVVQRDGVVQAMHAATGEVIWETERYGGFAVAPVVHNGGVYVFFGDDADFAETRGLLVHIDAEHGALLWRTQAQHGFPGLALAADGDRVVISALGRVEIFDGRSGSRTFWFTFRGTAGAVTVAAGVVYVVTSREVAALDSNAKRPWWEGVRQVWRRANLFGMAPKPPSAPSIWIGSSTVGDAYPPALSSHALIVADAGGTVVAVERNGGSTLWEVEHEAITASPSLTADGLVVPHASGLSVLDPLTGSVILDRAIPTSTTAEIVQVIATSSGLFVVRSNGAVSAFHE